MLDGLSMLSKVGGGFLAGAGPAAAPASPVAPSGASFATLVGDAWDSTVGSLKTAENASVMALSGEADTRMVVDAVMSAEQSLQTAIAIRDKIVSAYLEISRMAI